MLYYDNYELDLTRKIHTKSLYSIVRVLADIGGILAIVSKFFAIISEFVTHKFIMYKFIRALFYVEHSYT